jgi:hypothetical protein
MAKSTDHEALRYAVFSILVTSSLFGSNILLSTLFSNTISLCPSLNVRDQVSHPYKTTSKILVFYILIFKFFDSNREDGRFWTQWDHVTTLKLSSKSIHDMELKLFFCIIPLYLQSVLIHSVNVVRSYTKACRRVLTSTLLYLTGSEPSCDLGNETYRLNLKTIFTITKFTY